MDARLPQTALAQSKLSAIEKETTIFMSGNSRRVRIPKEFQLKTKQVTIVRIGQELIVKPKYATMAELMAAAPPLTGKESKDLFLAMTMAKRDALPAIEERDWPTLTNEPVLKVVKKAAATKKTIRKSKAIA